MPYKKGSSTEDGNITNAGVKRRLRSVKLGGLRFQIARLMLERFPELKRRVRKYLEAEE